MSYRTLRGWTIGGRNPLPHNLQQIASGRRKCCGELEKLALRLDAAANAEENGEWVHAPFEPRVRLFTRRRGLMPQVRRWWSKLPGLPALREVAIVVVGILIAFALDAWWEQRSTVARERAHLRALAGDFRQNAQRLERTIELEERTQASSRALLQMARDGRTASPDSVWKLLGAVYSENRFEPVMGAYEELENSAGLSLLRDDTLRASLAEFTATLDVRYSERFSDEIFLAFVRESAGELPFLAPYVAGDRLPTPIYQASQRLMRTTKFQEYLAIRHLAAHDVAHEYRMLGASTANIPRFTDRGALAEPHQHDRGTAREQTRVVLAPGVLSS